MSFLREHLKVLCQRDFFLCEKSDGLRCLLFFTVDEEGEEVAYAIDRRNDYYSVYGM